MAVQKNNGVKKGGWKIYVIILAAALVIGAAYIVFKIVTVNLIDDNNKILSGYFKFRSEDNKERIKALTSADFEDELASINLKGSAYVLYSYNISSDETFTNQSSDILKATKVTFGITLNENSKRVSYLGEAYLIKEDDGSIKIHYIRKLYRGEEINSLWQKITFKG